MPPGPPARCGGGWLSDGGGPSCAMRRHVEAPSANARSVNFVFIILPFVLSVNLCYATNLPNQTLSGREAEIFLELFLRRKLGIRQRSQKRHERAFVVRAQRHAAVGMLRQIRVQRRTAWNAR